MSKKDSYNEMEDVRIVRLPKMILACYCAESETPEEDCSKVTEPIIAQYKLDEKLGFRHFGFNNPCPTESSPVYGYEMWFVVPEDFKIPSPLWRKEFDGGLYAAIPTKMNLIGERWRRLWEWVQNNEKYEFDLNPDINRLGLEENINYEDFISDDIDFGEKQLDLLIPIKNID